MGGLEQTFANLCERYTLASHATRIALLENACNVVQQCKDLKEKESQSIIISVAKLLYLVDNRAQLAASRRIFCSSVSVGGKSFAVPLLSALEKLGARATKNAVCASAWTRLVLLSWSTALVEVADDAIADAELKRVVALELSLISSISSTRDVDTSSSTSASLRRTCRRPCRAARSAFKSQFRGPGKQRALDAAADAVVRDPSQSTMHALRALFELGAVQREAALKAVETALFSGLRGPVSLSAVDATRHIFASIAPDAVRDNIAPALGRALKRAPEHAVPLASRVFQYTRAELAPCATAVAEDLVCQLVHDAAARRSAAVDAVRSLLKGITDSGGVDAVVTALEGAASGKLVAATRPEGRIAVADALASVADAPAPGAAAERARALHALAALLAAEKVASARAALARACGKLIDAQALRGDSASARGDLGHVRAALVKAAESDSSRLDALVALAALASDGLLHGEGVAIAQRALAAARSDGAGAQRVAEGAAALALLERASSAGDDAAAGALSSEAKSDDSVSALSALLAEENNVATRCAALCDTPALAAAVATLCPTLGRVVAATAAAPSARALAAIALFDAAGARSSACAALRRASGAYPAGAAVSAGALCSVCDGVDPGAASFGSRASRLACGVRAVAAGLESVLSTATGSEAAELAQAAAALARAGAHPAAGAEARTRRARRIRRQALANALREACTRSPEAAAGVLLAAADVENATSESSVAAAVTSAATAPALVPCGGADPAGDAAASLRRRRSAARALAVLARDGALDGSRTVAPALLRALDARSFASLGPNDRDAALTSPGESVHDRKIREALPTASDRADASERADAHAALAALGRNAPKAAKSAREDAARASALTRESEARGRCAALVARACFAASCTTRIVETSPRALYGTAGALVTAARGLAPYLLAREAASEALYGLGGALAPALAAIADAEAAEGAAEAAAEACAQDTGRAADAEASVGGASDLSAAASVRAGPPPEQVAAEARERADAASATAISTAAHAAARMLERTGDHIGGLGLVASLPLQTSAALAVAAPVLSWALGSAADALACCRALHAALTALDAADSDVQDSLPDIMSGALRAVSTTNVIAANTREAIAALASECSARILPGNDAAVRALRAGFLASASGARHMAVGAAAAASPAVRNAVSDCVWLAAHDADEDVARTASALVAAADDHVGRTAATGDAPSTCAGLEPGAMVGSLGSLLAHPRPFVRDAGARAIAAACARSSDGALVAPQLARAFSLHARGAAPAASRGGAAAALRELAPLCAERDAPVVASFLLSHGLADEDERVRGAMLDAGIALVRARGGVNAGAVTPAIDAALGADGSDDPECGDRIREGAVTMLGAAAEFLPPGDPRRAAALDALIGTLSTPAEVVQRAVCDCLGPLAKGERDRARSALPSLLERLVAGASYGDRRGAAYGIAGIVRGLGIPALKQDGIMQALQEALDAKKDPPRRQGALFAIECLATTLRRLFEPYVIHILPLLLACFSDHDTGVRDAAEVAARAIMAELSAPGVKLVMPALLRGASDPAWRTKEGAVRMLGATAYCAPRQLATALPTVVPHLCEAMADSHPRVQSAALGALREVAGVTQNREIRALAPMLLEALADPAERTAGALNSLMSTTFVTAVDAASLALVVPILRRGLRDRSADAKRAACRIAGATCALVAEAADLAPHANQLAPPLREALRDPNPAVRAAAARALATIAANQGDPLESETLGWLRAQVRSDTSPAERAGGAQGLAELVAAAGDRAAAHEALDAVVADAADERAFVREGALSVFVFLPSALGDAFAPHIPRALPLLIAGACDEAEFVRDAAMRAAQALVTRFGRSSAAEILPPLLDGMAHANWRHRRAAVNLVGDLMSSIAASTSAGDTAGHAVSDENAAGERRADESDEQRGRGVMSVGADDDGLATRSQQRAVLETLGSERRAAVLAALYVARGDPAATVQHAAAYVWKSLVTHTGRALAEILPELVLTIIRGLAAADEERQYTAGRALGDLVGKLGAAVLARVLPLLCSAARAERAAVRQGACRGLGEVLAQAGSDAVAEYEADIVEAMRDALADPDASVRGAAAQAFDALHRALGARAVEAVVPALLARLSSPGADAGGESAGADENPVLDALRQLVTVRSHVVLPHLLPPLLEVPVATAHARALQALCGVAGAALRAHVTDIAAALVRTVALEGADVDAGAQDGAEGPAAQAAAARKALEALAGLSDNAGAAVLMDALERAGSGGTSLGPTPADSAAANRETAACLDALSVVVARAAGTSLLQRDALTSLIASLVPQLAHDDELVAGAAHRALGAATATIDKGKAAQYVAALREAVERTARLHGGSIPALARPRGLDPVLPVFLNGLLNGSAETRESAADAVGILVGATDATALRPYAIKITGPLIRVVGDRFPWPVKAAILRTLRQMLERAGPALKAFVPQLQTTFVRALSDTAPRVRDLAAEALGALATLTPRAAALAADLGNLAASANDADSAAGAGTDGGVRSAALAALAAVLAAAGDRVAPPARADAAARAAPFLTAAHAPTRDSAARCVGGAAASLRGEALASLVQSCFGSGSGGDGWAERHGGALALAHVLRAVAWADVHEACGADVLQRLDDLLGDERAPVRAAALGAVGALLAGGAPPEIASRFVGKLAAALKSDAGGDERQGAVDAVRELAKCSPESVRSFLPDLVPPLLAAARDRNIVVKLAAERALYHSLQIGRDDSVLTAYAATCEPRDAKLVTEYSRRVLSRLPAVSDDEDDAA